MRQRQQHATTHDKTKLGFAWRVLLGSSTAVPKHATCTVVTESQPKHVTESAKRQQHLCLHSRELKLLQVSRQSAQAQTQHNTALEYRLPVNNCQHQRLWLRSAAVFVCCVCLAETLEVLQALAAETLRHAITIGHGTLGSDECGC